MENSALEPGSVARERQNVPRKYERSIVPRPRMRSDTALKRAADWLLPWGLDDYPGIGRGLEQVSGIPRGTMKAYRSGRRRITARVARIFIDILRSRIEAGLAIISELEKIEREYVDKRTLPQGWRVVRDRDGVMKDGRGSFKRKDG